MINIIIKDLINITNIYNCNYLSEDFGNYLYEQSIIFGLKEKLVIKIDGLNQNEIINFKTKLELFCNQKITKLLQRDKTSDVIEMILLLIGILLLFSYYIIQMLNIEIVSEIMLIAGWVVIWEWAYKKIFTDNERKYQIRRYEQLKTATITSEKNS